MTRIPFILGCAGCLCWAGFSLAAPGGAALLGAGFTAAAASRSCGAQAFRLRGFAACGIFPGPGLNPCSLHWQENLPLYVQRASIQCCALVLLLYLQKQKKFNIFVHHFCLKPWKKSQTQPETSLILTAALSWAVQKLSLDNWGLQVWVPPTHCARRRTRTSFASRDNLFQEQASAGYASLTAGVRPVARTLPEHVIPLWSLKQCLLTFREMSESVSFSPEHVRD